LESKKKAKNFSCVSFLIFFLKSFHWLHLLHFSINSYQKSRPKAAFSSKPPLAKAYFSFFSFIFFICLKRLTKKVFLSRKFF